MALYIYNARITTLLSGYSSFSTLAHLHALHVVMMVEGLTPCYIFCMKILHCTSRVECKDNISSSQLVQNVCPKTKA